LTENNSTVAADVAAATVAASATVATVAAAATVSKNAAGAKVATAAAAVSKNAAGATVVTDATVTTGAIVFRVTDKVTGEPLAGAAFALEDCCGNTLDAVSRDDGRVVFPCLPQGNYLLNETGVPDGYSADTMPHAVIVSANGATTVDGYPAARFAVEQTSTTAIAFLNIDGLTGKPIAGASFKAAMAGGATATAVSDANGKVLFAGIKPGVYSVTETDPPVGYAPRAGADEFILRDNGELFVNGQKASNPCKIPNYPAIPTRRRPAPLPTLPRLTKLTSF
jgi:uncharacterized surface anchored protein